MHIEACEEFPYRLKERYSLNEGGWIKAGSALYVKKYIVYLSERFYGAERSENIFE